MADLPVSWPWIHLFGGPAQFGAVIFGLLLATIGALYLAHGLTGGAGGPLRAVPRLIPFDLANGLTSGLVVGLALGLAGGLALGLLPWHVGRPLLPRDLQLGVQMGLGCNIVFACAVGRATSLPRGLVLGAGAGTVVGLAAFRLLFGPTAGFGPETDMGVGTEVGLIFGLLGGLAGALVGALAGLRRSGATGSAAARGRRWWAIGMLTGAVGALAVGAAGWLTRAITFLVPYYGGLTDCSPLAGCTVRPPLFSVPVFGVIYGLGLFALGGALVGGLAGALAQLSRLDGRPALHWASLTAGLVAGLAAGLATGLQHLDIGGPAIPGRRFVWDPVAGGIGLVGGLAGGLVLGVLGAVLLARAERQPERHAATFGIVLLALGLVIWTMPGWFVPLVAIDIP